MKKTHNFFYLPGISGAGRGEIGAKASAELFNQLHPQIIESSMLTIYKTSKQMPKIDAVLPQRRFISGFNQVIQIFNQLFLVRRKVAANLDQVGCAVCYDTGVWNPAIRFSVSTFRLKH